MDGFDIMAILGVGIMIGIIIGGAIGTNHPMWTPEATQKLGSAICEEEYNMAFDKYSKGVLHCKHLGISYDGLQVNIGGD